MKYNIILLCSLISGNAIAAADHYELRASSAAKHRSCCLINPFDYMQIPQDDAPPEESHAQPTTFSHDEIIHCATKNDPKLTGHGSFIITGKNELLFYEFCTPHEKITAYLQASLPRKLHKLNVDKKVDHNVLKGIMGGLMRSFYATDNEVDAYDMDNHKITAHFLHVCGQKATMFDIRCAHNGTFKKMSSSHRDIVPYIQNILLFPITHDGQPCYTIDSPIVDLAKKHNFAQIRMLNDPQSFVKKVLASTTDDNIQAVVLFDASAWLKKIGHHSQTPEYKELRRQWELEQSVLHGKPANDTERQILCYAKSSKNKAALLKLAQDIFTQKEPAPSYIQAFIHDILEEAPPLE